MWPLSSSKIHWFCKLNISAPRGHSKAFVPASERKGDAFFLALYFVIFHASSLIFGNFLPKALQPALLHVGSPQKKNKYLRNHNPKVSYCLWGCLSPSWLLKSFQMSGSRKMTLKYFYFFPVRIMLIPRHQNPFWTLHCRPVGGSHHCILFVLGLGERNLGTFWMIG